MTPSSLTLKLKEAFQLHGNVNLWRYLITLLSSNLTWRILCLPMSWIETTTLFCAWRQYLFGNWSRFQICDPDLLTQYVSKTEVNYPQNGSHQLQYCLYLPIPPAPPIEWWALFSLPWNLGWPGDLLSSIEWGESDIVPDPTWPCFSSVQALSHYTKGNSYPRETT